MDSGKSMFRSPGKTDIFFNNTPQKNKEQSFLNANIKDEPLDITECSLNDFGIKNEPGDPDVCAPSKDDLSAAKIGANIPDNTGANTNKTNSGDTFDVTNKNLSPPFSSEVPVTRRVIINGQEKTCILINNPGLKRSLMESFDKARKPTSNPPCPSIMTSNGNTSNPVIRCFRCSVEVHIDSFRQHIDGCPPRKFWKKTSSTKTKTVSKAGENQTVQAMYNPSTGEVVTLRDNEPKSSYQMPNDKRRTTESNLASSMEANTNSPNSLLHDGPFFKNVRPQSNTLLNTSDGSPLFNSNLNSEWVSTNVQSSQSKTGVAYLEKPKAFSPKSTSYPSSSNSVHNKSGVIGRKKTLLYCNSCNFSSLTPIIMDIHIKKHLNMSSHNTESASTAAQDKNIPISPNPTTSTEIHPGNSNGGLGSTEKVITIWKAGVRKTKEDSPVVFRTGAEGGRSETVLNDNSQLEPISEVSSRRTRSKSIRARKFAEVASDSPPRSMRPRRSFFSTNNIEESSKDQNGKSSKDPAVGSRNKSVVEENYNNFAQNLLKSGGKLVEGSQNVSDLSFDSSLTNCQKLGNKNKEISKTSVHNSNTICNVSGNSNFESEFEYVNVTSDDENSPMSWKDSADVLLLLEDNTFSCSTCSFTTDKKIRLRDHERHHRKTNLPIFQCSYCSQRYTRYMLYLHVQNVHPGQRFQIRDDEPASTTDQPKLKLPVKKQPSKTAGSTVDPETSLRCSTRSFVTTDLHVKKHAVLPARPPHRFQCELCSYSTSHSSDMKVHLYSHSHNNWPIKKCLKCDFKSTPKALWHHMKICTKTSMSASKRNIKRSVKSASDEVKPKRSYKCSTCSFSTTELAKLKLHTKKHLLKPLKRTDESGRQFFDCRLCSYGCPGASDIAGHLNSHKKNLPIIKCTNCKFKSTSRALLYHMRKCKTNSESATIRNTKDVSESNQVESGPVVVKTKPKSLFKCTKCSFSTSLRIKLKLHIRKRHLKPQNPIEVRIFNCSRCSFSTSFSIKLTLHQKKCLAPTENELKCKLCSFTTVNKYRYDKHVKSHDRHVPIKKCPYCSFKSTARVLWKHRVAVGHINATPAKIDISRSSVSPKTGKKTYKCKLCDFVTVKCQSYCSHMRKHQTVEGSKCKLCSFVCSHPGYLSVHMRSHRLKKPIKKCPTCPFRSTPAPLKSHICDEHQSMASVGNTNRNDPKHDSNSESFRLPSDNTDIETNKTPSSDSNKSTFRCSLCSFTTSLRIKLNFHIKKYHKQMHLQEHDAKLGKRYNCKYCSYAASRKSSLKNHVNTHLKWKLPIKKCENCEYRSTKQALTFHLRECKENKSEKNKISSAENDKLGADTDVMTEKCSSSGKSRQNDPVSHNKESPTTDSSITNKKSNEMGAVTTENTLLNFHKTKYQQLNVEHVTKLGKLYRCNYCSYAAICQRYLEKHLNTHLKWKLPIKKCEYCDYRSTMHALRIHFKECKENQSEKNKISSPERNEVGADKVLITQKHSSSVGAEQNNSAAENSRHASQNRSKTLSSNDDKGPIVDTIIANRDNNEIGADTDQITKLSSSFKAIQSNSITENAQNKSKPLLRNNKQVSNAGISEVHKDGSERATRTKKTKSRRVPIPGSTSEEMLITSSGTFACPFCSYSTRNKSDMRRHIFLHRAQPVIKRCFNCSYRSTTTALMRHMRKCYQPNKPLYPTTDSGVSKVDSSKIARVNRKEENISPKKATDPTSPETFKCQYCSFTSFWSYLIERHMISHTLLKLSVEQCEKCDFRSTPAALSAHTNACAGPSKVDGLVTKKFKSDVPQSSKIDSNPNEVGNGSGSPEITASTSDFELTANKRKRDITNNASEKESRDTNMPVGAATNSSKAVFRCPKCPFATHLRIKLKFHLQKHHLVSKTAVVSSPSPNICLKKCQYCSHSCRERYLKKHELTHTVHKLPISKCFKCDFKSTKYALRDHERKCFKVKR